MCINSLQKFKLFSGGLVEFRIFLRLLQTALHDFHVAEEQLGIDRINVVCRIDLTVHMNDIVIFKAAHHMNDGFNFTDMSKELVSKAFALGSTFYKACDIAELNGGIDCFL